MIEATKTHTLDLDPADIAAIEILASVINRHSTRSEAGDITISAWGDTGKVTLSASDNDDLTIVYRFERAPSEPYAVGLDATFLAAVTKGELSASIALRESSGDVCIGTSRLVAPGHASDEYPAWDSSLIAAVTSGANPADAIQRISDVARSASSEEARGAVLMGTLFEFDSERSRVRIVATDGYQIAMDSFEAMSAGRAQFIVPSHAARFLAAIRDHAEAFSARYASLEIRTSRRAVHFCYGPFELVVRYVDGTYPRYSSVTEPGPTAFLIVERHEFLEALQRAWTVASDRCSFAILTASAATREVVLTIPGESGRESYVRMLAVGGDITEDIRCALNAKYTADIVSRMRGFEIAIGFVDHGKRLAPLTFRDVGDVDAAQQFTPFSGAVQFALMPLRQ